MAGEFPIAPDQVDGSTAELSELLSCDSRPTSGAQLDHILAEIRAASVGLQVDHEVGEAVGDRVELVLEGLITPGLAVLEQCHHQERNYGRHRVDDELPCVDIAKQKECRRPDEHEEDAHTEERGSARDPRRPTRKAIEHTDARGNLARHQDCSVTIRHVTSCGSRRAKPRAENYLTTPAITLTITARITAPKRYESSACRTTVRRIPRTCTSVSETWKVIPTVNATYAKSR
jgi:hypothetical protein